MISTKEFVVSNAFASLVSFNAHLALATSSLSSSSEFDFDAFVLCECVSHPASNFRSKTNVDELDFQQLL